MERGGDGVMKIPATALFSAVLFVASVSALAIPTINVNVTNFPLDTQGNIRVTQMNKDQNVNVTNLPLDEQGNLKIKVAEKPLQKYKGSVTIDFAKTYVGQYAYISTELNPHVNATLPFTFSPRQQNFNVTRIWISFIMHGANRWYSLNFTLNGKNTIYLKFFAMYSSVTSFETNPSFHKEIVQGINVLTISDLYKDFVTPITEYIAATALFIEYEYLA